MSVEFEGDHEFHKATASGDYYISRDGDWIRVSYDLNDETGRSVELTAVTLNHRDAVEFFSVGLSACYTGSRWQRVRAVWANRKNLFG